MNGRFICQIMAFMLVLLGVMIWICPSLADDEETSWLADDMKSTYNQGTLNYLNDPTGSGLSVYKNYVFYVNGSDYFHSKWKNPTTNTNLPTGQDWVWGSGSTGGWTYSPNGDFSAYQLVTPPTYVYLGQEQISYSAFVATPSYRAINHLYIQGQDSWSNRVVAPQGSSVWLLAYTKTAGQAMVYKTTPSGTTTIEALEMPAGYSHLMFSASDIGRNLVTFVKDDIPSDVAVIDVTDASAYSSIFT